MEIKSKLDYTFHNLKLLLIKTGLNFWINSEREDSFHYIYESSIFKTHKSLKNFRSENFGLEDHNITLDKNISDKDILNSNKSKSKKTTEKAFTSEDNDKESSCKESCQFKDTGNKEAISKNLDEKEVLRLSDINYEKRILLERASSNEKEKEKKQNLKKLEKHETSEKSERIEKNLKIEKSERSEKVGRDSTNERRDGRNDRGLTNTYTYTTDKNKTIKKSNEGYNTALEKEKCTIIF